ncbi:MAG: hypothetical protein ACKPKO_30810, partial [Candidatus Fonsibacter sp.]
MREDYSENFIKDVLNMCERTLSVPLLVCIIVEQYNKDGHNALCNNIGKLAVFASNTVTQENRSVSWTQWRATRRM